MKTIAKFVGGIFVLFALLIIALTVYLKFFFDPNDLRSQITEQVKERTGRDLVIEGDFALSTFPWISVDIGRTSLSDDPSFGNDTLLAFERASASIKLMPLLSKRIELGTTSIEGAKVTVITRADGQNNWTSFIDSLSDADSGAEPAAQTAGSTFVADTLGAINIVDADVAYSDQRSKETLRFAGFNLKTGELTPNSPFDVQLNTRMAATDVDLQVELQGEATLDASQLSLSKPTFTVAGNHYALPFTNFSVDLNSDSLTLAENDYQLVGTVIDWTVSKGKESAATVSQASGSLTTPSLKLTNESIATDAMELAFDTTMVNSAVKTANGTFKAAAVSGRFDDLALTQPVLEFDTQVDNESVNKANGTFKANAMSFKNNARLGLASPQLATTVQGSGLFDKSQAVTMKGEALAFDLDSGALRLNNYQATALDFAINGSIKGDNVLEKPVISGPIAVQNFNLKQLLERLDVEMDTADKNALAKASFQGELKMTETSSGIDQLSAVIDDSRITGSVRMDNGKPVFNLKVDKLDADRYMAPVGADGNAGSRGVDQFEVPAQQLRDLNMSGRLEVGQLTMSGIQSRNAAVTIAADGGNVRLHPMGAEVYGGTYSGDVRVDARGEVPVVSLNERFTNVDFGALSKDLADSSVLSGRVTGSLTVTARGHNTSDLKASSDGTVQFSFADGVLEGVNVMETVRNIVATANKEPRVEDVPDRTEFRKLAGTAQIKQGVLTNNDLSVQIPLMNVTGAGSVDLNTKAIEYKVGAKVVKEGDIPLEKELRYISDYTLPLYIAGTYEAPVVDKARSATDLIGQFAKKKAKDKILDVLSDRLGLGSKEEPVAEGEAGDPKAGQDATKTEGEQAEEPLTPDEERKRREEELKDELDNKIKDKLKDLFGG